MGIGLHMHLLRVLEIITAIAGGFAGYIGSYFYSPFDINPGFAAFASFIVVVVLFRNIVTNRIPARCPKCDGKTYFRGGKPISYHCRDCGHVQETSWGEGNIFPTKAVLDKADVQPNQQKK